MKQNANFVKRQIGTQTVIVAVGEASKRFNGMLKVNETGAFLWDRLQNDVTSEDLVAALTAEYEVDADTARRDVEALLATLRGVGAVE